MHLPLGLLLLLTGSQLTNAEQCRLRAKNMLNDPSFPATTTFGNGTMTPTGTNSNGQSSTSSTSATPTRTPFNYGSEPVRGVNLGGWLVLEPWITPSIFDNTGDDAIVDEYTLGQRRNNDEMRKILDNHWNTVSGPLLYRLTSGKIDIEFKWITEDDFRNIRAAGLNHVRIPVGYWSVPMTSRDTQESTDPSPYIPGAWPYLLRGLNWAATHGVHVIVDLHGAPGSQNGYDNSGQRTDDPRWAYNPSNVTRTIDTLKVMAREIGGMIDVLELLNESAGFKSGQWAEVTRQFWLDGYRAVREAGGNGFRVMIGDAFLGLDSWTNFMEPPQAQGVLIDFHQYQVFSNQELARSFDEHISHTCSMKSGVVNYATNNLWTVMGEWSNAITDCAKYLNGRGVGYRWDGTRAQDDMRRFGSCDSYTGSYRGFSDEYKAFLRRYFEAQIDISEAAQGWVYWPWKAEIADDWSYEKGLEGGWIPQNPSDRMYPNICS
ncbi:hypothetical protein AAF712_011226 [Marasmius tenuissimus]|uniref:Glycoside hydrolase family 5 domain-containing protein n=1 Tax=Marasmius tenuissimus TaxID=585030 RepID=A0ABR2ZL92_9AGAR